MMNRLKINFDLRLPLLALAALMALATAATVVYAVMLDRRVDRALAETRPPSADDAVTTATTTTVAPDRAGMVARTDRATAATRPADGATTATQLADGATSKTATANAPTTATRVADRPSTAPLMADRPATATLAEDRASTAPLARDGATTAPRATEALTTPSAGARPPRPARPDGPGGGPEGEARGINEKLTQLLEQKPVFGQKPKQQPALQGILGTQAMISGSWVELGKEQNGVKLLEIHANKVVIEFEGQKRDLTLWQDLPGLSQ